MLLSTDREGLHMECGRIGLKQRDNSSHTQTTATTTLHFFLIKTSQSVERLQNQNPFIIGGCESCVHMPNHETAN